MRRIREILRLCWELKLGQSKVAQSLGISSSTVNRLIIRATTAGLTWPLPADLDDTALERLLYPPPEDRPQVRPEPDWTYIHSQLKLKGVTLVLLWQEYKEQHPDGYQLTQSILRPLPPVAQHAERINAPDAPGRRESIL